MATTLATQPGVTGLLAAVADRPNHTRTYTPPQRPPAVATILKGILDWLDNEPTIQAAIVEDMARMIERCHDGEELRDLSVQIRDLMLNFEPDASRVALTPAEACILHHVGG